MYRSVYVFADDALDHIKTATNCSELDAWLQFIDLAADGELPVWLDGHAVPIACWKRSRRNHDLYTLTDAHRMEVRITDLQGLLEENAPEAEHKTTRRRSAASDAEDDAVMNAVKAVVGEHGWPPNNMNWKDFNKLVWKRGEVEPAAPLWDDRTIWRRVKKLRARSDK